MKISKTDIEDVLLIEPDVFGDERGWFMESYRKDALEAEGVDTSFVQDNVSFSEEGIVRGLHYQIDQPQDKLVMVLEGEILDVAVDLRRSSPSFGNYTAEILSSATKKQLYIPKGFAHGFSVLSGSALVYYKCSDYYFPEGERGLRWNDPDLNIDWGTAQPRLSDKDQNQPLLSDIPEKDLFD